MIMSDRTEEGIWDPPRSLNLCLCVSVFCFRIRYLCHPSSIFAQLIFIRVFFGWMTMEVVEVEESGASKSQCRVLTQSFLVPVPFNRLEVHSSQLNFLQLTAYRSVSHLTYRRR